MFNSILDLIVCGEYCDPCMKPFQEENTDCWKDLTLQSMVPNPKTPPVPKFVKFPDSNDDVSALNDQYSYSRHEGIEDGPYNDLELRIEGLDNNVDRVLVEQNNHTHSCIPSQDDSDGSSYSSYKRTVSEKTYSRKHTFTWHTEPTDTTMDRQNYSLRSILKVR